MKNTNSNLLVLIFFSVFFFSFINVGGAQEKIIDVQDYRNVVLPAPDLETHKHKDVEVQRIISRSDGYMFCTYGDVNGELQYFSNFIYEVDFDFNKAHYQWESDTLLLIRLFNSDTEKELNFRMYGSLLDKGTSTLKVVDYERFEKSIEK